MSSTFEMTALWAGAGVAGLAAGAGLWWALSDLVLSIDLPFAETLGRLRRRLAGRRDDQGADASA